LISQYTNEQKEAVYRRYKKGETGTAIAIDVGIPRSTVYGWIKKFSDIEAGETGVSLKKFRSLEHKVKRLKNTIEIMNKSHCLATDPLEVKLEALEKLYGQYSVHMLCDALNVSRATFYNHIWRNKRDNTWYAKRREELRIKIQQIYDDNHQIYGASKICAVMKREGYRISEKMVRQIMCDLGLLSIREDAKDFYDKYKSRYNNRLKQNFSVDAPNQVWVGDITCFRFKNVTYHICVIIDLFARVVVGYKIGRKNSTQLAKSTFKNAYENRGKPKGLIFHSDRGGCYVSYSYREYLKVLNVEQSFSRSGMPYDNAVIESFFATMKREELYRVKYRSENEFKTAVDVYIQFYNQNRPHSTNKYKTPNEREDEYFTKQADL